MQCVKNFLMKTKEVRYRVYIQGAIIRKMRDYFRKKKRWSLLIWLKYGLGRIVVIFAVNLKEKPTDALIIYSVLML